MPNSLYVTVAQAAVLLNESRWTTRRRIKNGSLPALKLGDNTSGYLIRRSDIDAIVASQRLGAA